QAEDGIRDRTVTGVQTCALPISSTAETAILIVEDVTERERARQSEREFVENAAHELRTPLAAIVSVMDVLESGAKDIPEARDRRSEERRVGKEWRGGRWRGSVQR